VASLSGVHLDEPDPHIDGRTRCKSCHELRPTGQRTPSVKRVKRALATAVEQKRIVQAPGRTAADAAGEYRRRRHNQDPPTSHAAAAAVTESGSADTIRRLVRDALARFDPGGLTASELGRELGLDRVVVARRLTELVKDGAAYYRGQRRSEESGRHEMVAHAKGAR
jgi:hypothetical protein